jgi:hypothetical protein
MLETPGLLAKKVVAALPRQSLAWLVVLPWIKYPVVSLV